MIRTAPVFVALIVFVSPVPASVKVGGSEFVPKDLIFASADSNSQASAEGPLPNQCQWTFLTETRIGRRDNSDRCVRFYFKTTVVLSKSCPSKDVPPVRYFAERITATNERCPDSSGRLELPPIDTKVVSSGTMADGKHQDIIRQADGTRVTLTYDSAGAQVTAAFPDGTRDVLKVP